MINLQITIEFNNSFDVMIIDLIINIRVEVHVLQVSATAANAVAEVLEVVAGRDEAHAAIIIAAVIVLLVSPVLRD